MSRVAVVVLGAERGVAETLAQVRAGAAGGERVELRVLLMPPLVQVRRVDLPRMTVDDARRAIARNVARYFPDAKEPQTVAVARVATSWIVAAAPAATVAAVHELAREHGWDVGVVEPAHAAWARAARDGECVVAFDEGTTVLSASRGAIASVRRLPAGGPLPPDLSGARWMARNDQEARALARLHAGGPGSALDLVPDSERAWRLRVARRAVWSLAACAAALLILAAGATLWGEHRELNALRDHRAGLRDRVHRALATRDTLVETGERLGAIASLEQGSERWSAVIAQVAGALPADASLTAFRAEADSVSLEGQARNAAGVFAALRSAPGFVAVRASAPVRQEGGGATGAPLVERFTLGARVNPRAGETP